MNQQRLQQIAKSEGYHKTCLRESLAYICFSIGNQLREENDEWMRSVGLMFFDIKHLANQATAAFNRYDNVIRQSIVKDMSTTLCEDYEKVRKALYQFAGLEDKDNEEEDNNKQQISEQQ